MRVSAEYAAAVGVHLCHETSVSGSTKDGLKTLRQTCFLSFVVKLNTA